MSNTEYVDNQHVHYFFIENTWYVGNDVQFGSAFDTQTNSRITIPETINGEPVTVISSYSFDEFKELKSVVIKAPVTIIKTHAFANCPRLEYINIPSTVTTLEDNALQCYDTCESKRKGLLVVAFDAHPQIQSLGPQNFAFKEFTHIYRELISPIVKSSSPIVSVTFH